jgi:hypothetical protein
MKKYNTAAVVISITIKINMRKIVLLHFVHCLNYKIYNVLEADSAFIMFQQTTLHLPSGKNKRRGQRTYLLG